LKQQLLQKPLQKLWQSLPPRQQGNRYIVAYSGGMDSSVLLHALRDVSDIRAVHVNHGMQAQAAAWEQHCEKSCQQWDIPITICRVQPDTSQNGPEAGARYARYAALANVMQAGDVLLTAQHAHDQAETFLLQALRGAGIHGLAGMPALAPFGPGQIARPILGISRPELLEYAQTNELVWVEDPSNADSNLSRAYLRTQVSPHVKQKWPGFEQRLARSARWCADASELADEFAAIDFLGCQGPVDNCLSAAALKTLSAVRQNNLLRYWLKQLDLALPDHRHMQQIKQLLDTDQHDSHPLVHWADVDVRRFQDWVFAMPALVPVPKQFSLDWDMREPLVLPAGCGQLESLGPQPTSPVTVRMRRGGERLQLNGRDHHTSLKQLLQASKMPSWVRERLPLVFIDQELVAVADYWHSDAYTTKVQTPAPRLRWSGAPPGAELVRVVGNNAFS